MTHLKQQTAISFKKLAVFAFCIILAVVVVLGIVISKSLGGKKYYFASGATFYCYYTEETTAQNAESATYYQKKSGGAGFNYSLGAKTYICAFLYKTKEEAERIKQTNIISYAQGGIIELKTTPLSSRAQKIVKNNEAYISLIHFFEDAFGECYNLAVMLDNQTITESKLLTKVLLMLEKANEINAKFEITDPLCASIELLCFEMKDYMAKTNGKIERSSGIKLLCFKIVELCNACAEILNNRN